jgi:L-ascorbate metabolism protein UlaG (beta-lactamase superfamily)
LRITFVGHASLIFEVGGKVIHIDPWTKQGDYTKFPKADLILVTHEHFDHLDSAAIAEISKSGTRIVGTSAVHDELKKGEIMKNGDTLTVDGFTIEAVPAYNITPDHLQFHPKGRGNGYVLTIGGKRIYVAGDTEDITDMANLKKIDIAFLPMNQPYTMLPDQAAHAAEMFHPKILYPYHTGDTDIAALVKLLAKDKDIEVRVRKMP